MAADNPLIAFSGEVECLNATWSLDGGRRLELRICGEAFGRNHPFKRFQQKRNGHVGTRFKASFARISTGECVGMMELMLCAWKDSSSIGQSVTFCALTTVTWLPVSAMSFFAAASASSTVNAA